jgi:hypothetical protein
VGIRPVKALVEGRNASRHKLNLGPIQLLDFSEFPHLKGAAVLGVEYFLDAKTSAGTRLRARRVNGAGPGLPSRDPVSRSDRTDIQATPSQ